MGQKAVLGRRLLIIVSLPINHDGFGSGIYAINKGINEGNQALGGLAVGLKSEYQRGLRACGQQVLHYA